MKGIVTRSTGSWYSVRAEDGTYVDCRLRGRIRLKGQKATNPVAVGDIVEFEVNEGEKNAVIVDIKERKNYIIRRSVNLSKVSHIIASNIDRAFVVICITSPRTSTGFIDRFLVTAEAYEIPATIIVNKIDIHSEIDNEILQLIRDIYEPIGYPVMEVSALRGDGIDELKNELKYKTSLFSGHSGVGKSALINALQPGLNVKTSGISDVHNKGKHTTTFAEMHELDFGGFIIDTPGIKEFGLIDFEKNELAMYFPEMLRTVEDCQFYNCTHVHEPKCAVKEAVEKGEISQERYVNYLNMLSGNDMQTQSWELK